jgi:tRNA nucleotidyltransferase (CCA-adding enzyme)
MKIADSAPAPMVMGRDLIALGLRPGVEFGRILKDCYEAQLDGVFACREDGIAYVRKSLKTS